jgi:LysM repeat protein
VLRCRQLCVATVLSVASIASLVLGVAQANATTSSLDQRTVVLQKTAPAVTVVHYEYHYRVEAGDTLSGIAQKEYGSSAEWVAIWKANPAVKDPGKISIGELLNLPKKPAPVPIAAVPVAYVTTVVSSASAAESYAESLFGSSYSCISYVIRKESDWNVHAVNPSSGAYGIPQALPGSKMAADGADWENDAATQLRWMKGYVDAVYGGACGAMEHEERYGWY